MDLLAVRVRRAAAAVLATAALLSASGAPVVAGHLPYDRECAPALAEHDHTAHRIQKAPGAEPDHCVACHVARIVRDSVPARARFDATLISRAVSPHADRSFASADSLADDTRGPPSQQYRF